MSERNNGKPICDAQIRLLLPQKWVDELDTIAASRHLSRLALIRGYLRSRIDHDPNKLVEHWQIQQTNDATCRKLKRVSSDYVNSQKQSDLNESSLLNKGFALTQTARHRNNAQKMTSSLVNVKSLCQKGKSESDLSKKNDIVLDAISELSRALTYSATMSSANINVTAAPTVLSHDVKKEIQNALTKKRR